MNAVEKAFELRYPLFLSSAALQEFHRQLKGSQTHDDPALYLKSAAAKDAS